MNKENANPGIGELVTAALLHDIGKVFQRAQSRKFDKGLEQTLCPFVKDKGFFSHRHVLYTDRFLEEMKAFFPPDINHSIMTALAVKHHKPDNQNPMEWLLAVADRVSAGSDRLHLLEQSDESRIYYETPLRSIFDRIRLENRAKPGTHWVRPKTMGRRREFAAENVQINRKEYAEIGEEFASGFRKLPLNSLDSFLSALNSHMEKCLNVVPSAAGQKDEPDVSLYDHCMTTAAFAAALFRYHEAKGNLNDPQSIQDNSTRKFRLVSGDLSGIQDYIFDLKSTRYNAKLLRAKSFELQALCDTCARMILDRFRLPRFSRIMNAGGRFLLVIPEIPGVLEVLEDARAEIETYCLEHHFGMITLNLSPGLVVAQKDIMQEKMPDLFRKIQEDIYKAKTRKLQSGLAKTGHVLSKEYDRIRESGSICPSCGIRASGDSEEFCDTCSWLIRLGTKLPSSRYILITREKPDVKDLVFPGNYSLECGGAQLRGREGDLMAINRSETGMGTIHLPYYVPVGADGNVKTFEDLATQAGGVQKLAMFKADLDHLGLIFSSGLGTTVSISRLSAVSREIDHFFSTYLNDLILQDFPNIYLVYSGGDDLCIVGPWSDVIDFSLTFHKNFAKLVSENESVTVSAGVVLFGSSVPVGQVVRQAEAALSQSKDGGRNRVTLFGETVEWEKYKELVDIGRKWGAQTQINAIPKGLLHRLIDYGARERAMVRKGEVSGRNALWRSALGYDVTRNLADRGMAMDFYKQVETHIGCIAIPASIAMYLTRGKEGE